MQCSFLPAFVLKMEELPIFFLSSTGVVLISLNLLSSSRSDLRSNSGKNNFGGTPFQNMELVRWSIRSIIHQIKERVHFNWSLLWVSVCRPSRSRNHGKVDCMVTMSNAVRTNPEWKRGTKTSLFITSTVRRGNSFELYLSSLWWRTSGSVVCRG